MVTGYSRAKGQWVERYSSRQLCREIRVSDCLFPAFLAAFSTKAPRTTCKYRESAVYEVGLD
jgi:hypothetical protein